MLESFRKWTRYLWIALAVAVFHLTWIGATRYFSRDASPHQIRTAAPVYDDGGPGLQIAQFYTMTGELVRGEQAVICYGVRNASAVRLDPPEQPLKPSFNRCFGVTPKQTTTYTLYAEGEGGATRSASFTIAVKPPAPRIFMLSQSHKEIVRGDAVTLCYSMKDAVRARLDPTSFPVAPAVGQCLRLYPRQDTKFTLIAFGEDGRTDQGTVNVRVK